MNIKLNKNSENAIYAQLGDELKGYISREKLKPGEMLPDIKTIAHEAGVSLKTAERALDVLIKEGICFRRPKKGTFVADRAKSRINASRSSGSSTPCISFILSGSDFSDPYHMRVLRGAEEMAFAKGFHLIYSSVPYNKDSNLLEKKLFSILGRGDLRAVLLGGKLDFDLIKKIDSTTGVDVPTIVMGRASGGFCEGVSHITDSNGLAMRTALRHLLDNGHKKIAFINESLNWAWNREIKDDFFQFMKFNGLPVLKNAIEDNLPDDEQPDAYRSVLQMISAMKKELVTAIACGTDRLAQGAIRALKENGIDVPGEISVIGCGNLELGKYLDPQLTTVDQCQEEKGREGILAAIGEYPKGSIIRIPVNLIERNSVKGVS